VKPAPLRRIVLAALLAGPLAASADELPNHRLLSDQFRISLGSLYAESTSQARLGSSTGGAGVDVIFEDALGLESRKLVGELGMYWRFAEDWRFDLSYFSLKRSADRALTADIEWGDNSYTAGTVVSSSLNISDLRAAVGYSFFRRRDKELGVGLGLHSTAFKASLEAAGAGGRSESVTAPLPFLALYGNFALTDTWALSVRADWLSLSYDKYSGGIRATAFDVVYQPYRNFAFGFGMHSLNLRLDVDNPDSKFAARLALQGPAAFVSYSF
jgi:hypothetical protein